MPEVRAKFAPQVDALLAQARELAKNESRQIQALVDEALADLLEKHRKTRSRPHVMAAYHKPAIAVMRICMKSSLNNRLSDISSRRHLCIPRRVI